MDMEAIQLSQLVTDVKITLQNRYETPLWVVAEISEMNVNRTGHCYLELIEKDSLSDKIIAKSRATIWAFTFRNLRAYFETTSGESLRAGLRVLVKASVEFHELYGFSLNVKDIDPQYTLGDMARKRALIIQQLNDEGVLEMNKGLPFPLVPQRIAVISSETAAGYGDFSDQLNTNATGYRFYTELFPAQMQGEKAAESVIQALEAIYNRVDEFDVIAIMRGGGSKSDLSCFDDYQLAYFITQFPLPIITGIGHERDDTVTDMVAHTKLKTPTALAEFLIDRVGEFHQQLDDYGIRVMEITATLFEKNEYLLERFSHRLQVASGDLVQKHQEFLIWAKSKVINGAKQLQQNRALHLEVMQHDLSMLAKSALSQETRLNELRSQRLSKWLGNYFGRKERKLEFLNEKAEWVNPERILQKGYAWVTHQGKIVKDSTELQKGDAIEVKLAKGSLSSEVTQVHKNS